MNKDPLETLDAFILKKMASKTYHHGLETWDLDSARLRTLDKRSGGPFSREADTIEAKLSERGAPFPRGKGDEAAEDTRRSGGPSQCEADEPSESARRDRLGEVAASPNPKFQAHGGITQESSLQEIKELLKSIQKEEQLSRELSKKK